jgi:hypothetical protein
MSLEKRLMENMLRFGSKNLTEYDQKILKRMIQEQTATPTTPTTAAPKAATPAPAATPATDKWGIPGFTAPAIGSANAEFGPKAQSPGTAWIEAYKTYLDNASGWIGKTVVVLKREMLYPDEIVERFVVQYSYAFSGTGQEVLAVLGKCLAPLPERHRGLQADVLLLELRDDTLQLVTSLFVAEFCNFLRHLSP